MALDEKGADLNRQKNEFEIMQKQLRDDIAHSKRVLTLMTEEIKDVENCKFI